VYFGSFDGNIYACDANSGTKLWSYTTTKAYTVESSPAVVDGVLYIGAGDGYLYALTSGPTSSASPPPSTNPTPTTYPTQTATPKQSTTPTSSPSAPNPTPTQAATIPATKSDGSTVNLKISGNITSAQMSNINITSEPSKITLSFTLTGESGSTGFGNVTIPKTAVASGATPTIYIDGTTARNQGYTQDADNYYVWYTSHFSTHQISIVFQTTSTSPMPTPQLGFPQEYLYVIAIAVIIVVAVVATVAVKKIKNKQPNPTFLALYNGWGGL
jgi:hypothetical protein